MKRGRAGRDGLVRISPGLLERLTKVKGGLGRVTELIGRRDGRSSMLSQVTVVATLSDVRHRLRELGSSRGGA